MKKLLATLAIVLVVLITGCKKDQTLGKVGVCPLVVSTIPADKAVDVPLNQIVSATFNERMNPATITGASYTLTGASTIAGTISFGGTDVTIASFTPDIPLTPYTKYTGLIKTSVKDLMGNALQADYVWTFTTIPQVTLSSNPAVGGLTTGAGTFALNSVVPITAVPNVGYTFTNWAENGTIVSTSASYQLTMTGNRTLVANFVPVFLVIVSSNPIAGGTTSGAGTFAQGSSVTVTAIPSAGYNFANWTENGVAVSATATYTFTISGNRTLVANYTPIQYIVALSSNPSAGGTAFGAGTFNSGSSVTVTAVANAGYTFTNWTESGTVVSSSAAYTFTISGNRTLVANFTASYTVTVLSVPLAGGTTTGAGTFNSGASVTVRATPNTGYSFTNWTENGVAVSATAIYTFTISGNRILVANYTSTAPPFSPVVDLKTAGRFGILAGTAVSNDAGFSVINNMDVGLSPGARSSVTGFPPATVVGGAIYAADDLAPPGTPAMLTQAKQDLTDAYLFAEGATAPAPATVSGDQGGKTLAPGIYKSTSTLLIQSGDLTLDGQGDVNATWIFQIAAGFTTVGGAGGNVILTGNAQAKNVFWQVGSSATIGDYTIFYGNVLALTTITMNSHAVATGRMLARNGAVTMTSTNIINKP